MTRQAVRTRPRRWIMLRLSVLAGLTAVWILLWGSFSAANVLSGLVVALLITVALPLPPVPVQGRVHPLSLLNLIIRVAIYLVMSSFQIAWLAIRPGPAPLSAVLRAKLTVKSDLVLALAVNIYNLIPGSIVLEIDQVRRLIYCHVINVGSEKAVKQFYHQVEVVERLLIAAFERDDEWKPASREELEESPESTEEAPR